jgi:stress response protein SCP2
MFRQIAHKVATPTLFSILGHFDSRLDSSREIRVFTNKKANSVGYVIPNELTKFTEEQINAIKYAIEGALYTTLALRDNLGKVYICDKLKKYITPFAERKSSKALKTLTRGSRIALDNSDKYLRLFIHWKNIDKERVDLDLSVIFYDENWKTMDQVSWTNLRSNGVNCVHSGDITNAPNGASEFIDIDIDQLKNANIKYATMSIYSFTGQEFSVIPECFAGYMVRQELGSGEIFEPSTVANKIDVTSESTNCLPFILDVDNREIVWADIAGTGFKRINSTETTSITISPVAWNICNPNKPSLYTVFEANAKARGTLVATEEEADIVFSLEGDVTPYDINKICSEFI